MSSRTININKPSLTLNRISTIFTEVKKEPLHLFSNKDRIHLDIKRDDVAKEGMWSRFKSFILDIITTPFSNSVKESKQLKRKAIKNVYENIEFLKNNAIYLYKYSDFTQITLKINDINRNINSERFIFKCHFYAENLFNETACNLYIFDKVKNRIFFEYII